MRVSGRRVDWVSIILSVALAALITPLGIELWLILKSGRWLEVAESFFRQDALLQSSVLALGFYVLLIIIQLMARSKLNFRDTLGLVLRGAVLGYLTVFLVSILLGSTREIYASLDQNWWTYGLEALSLTLYVLVDSIDTARNGSPPQS